MAACGLLSVLFSPAAWAEEGEGRTAVAVMDLGTSGNINRAQVEGLELVLADVISRHPHLRALMPSEIEAMLGLEAKRQLMGCETDSNCLAEIGGALGASYLLRPQVANVAGTWLIQLALIDTENAATLARATREVSSDTRLVAELRSAAEEILKALPGAQTATLATPEAGPAIAGAPATAIEPAVGPSTSKRAHSMQQGKSVLFWVGIGTGSALAAGGGVLWGSNRRQASLHQAAAAEWRDYLDGKTVLAPTNQDLLTRTEANHVIRNQRVGVLLMALGAGLIAGGVTSGSLGRPSSSSSDTPRVQAGLTPLPGGAFASFQMTWSGP